MLSLKENSLAQNEILLIPLDFPNCQPLFDKTPPNSLAVTHVFTSICNVSDAKKIGVTQSNIQETANTSEKFLKRHESAALSATPFRPVIGCRIKHG